MARSFSHLEWTGGVMQWSGIKIWPRRCLEQHCRLGMYVANLPTDRRVCRAVAWVDVGRHVIGFPRHIGSLLARGNG